jgi:hypothetical protein
MRKEVNEIPNELYNFLLKSVYQGIIKIDDPIYPILLKKEFIKISATHIISDDDFLKYLKIFLNDLFIYVFEIESTEKPKYLIGTDYLFLGGKKSNYDINQEQLTSSIEKLATAFESIAKSMAERNEFLKALEEKILPLVMNHTK